MGGIDTIDFLLAIKERWFLVVVLAFIFVGYIVTMDIKKFLTIALLPMGFQLVWELMTLGLQFPFFSLVYFQNVNIDLYIVVIPVSSLFLKSFIFATPCYLVGSGSTVKNVHSRIDLVKDRGKKIYDYMIGSVVSSVIFTVTMMAVEPILANGHEWFLGHYEVFWRKIYFRVDALYFIGVLVSSMITFLVVSLVDANLGYPKNDVKFNFEREVQSSGKHHKFGYLVLTGGLVTVSFISFFIDVALAVINFAVAIPVVFLIIILAPKGSKMLDDHYVNQFCADNPDSFLCDL